MLFSSLISFVDKKYKKQYFFYIQSKLIIAFFFEKFFSAIFVIKKSESKIKNLLRRIPRFRI